MMLKVTVRIGLVIAAVSLLCGCAALGPKTIMHDRLDYTTVLSDSWKDQMLLNIVKIRYGDVPVFLDIASVINSYELSGRAHLYGNMKFPTSLGAGGDAGLDGSYANRPTITYSPLSGEKFAKSLMSPIPVSPILSLIQSGYQADVLLRVFVQSINGIENQYTGRHSGDAAFYQLIERIRRIQDAGAIGMRLAVEDGEEVLLIVFRENNEIEIEADIAEVKKLLGIDPRASDFRVVYGTIPSGDKEIEILSRSMLQVLNELAWYIEVPEPDVADNRVNRGYRNELVEGKSIPPLIKISSSPQKPDDAFVAIPYQNKWFWIDNKDFSSKQIFSFLMFSFTLVETSGKDGMPIVTVPVR
jgi:hypothetical protein